MRNIWISSDLHLNHANFLNFKDENGEQIRKFADVDEMNEFMIQEHNKLVKPNDIWYNLGDVFFGSKDWFEANFKRMNGKKRLIVGNHDDVPYLCQHFEKVMLWRPFPEFGLLFSHVPVHEENLLIRHGPKAGQNALNVHGHIHNNPSPPGPYKNVCVEWTKYAPIHIDDINSNR